MTDIRRNIPEHLLKPVEDDESTKTILIEEKTTAVKKTASKKKKEEKPACQAAARHQTINDALVAMRDKNLEVYVIREARDDDPSKIKETAYSKCTISALTGKNYCHHHDDCKNLKNFETDILPRGEDDIERRKLNSKDDLFFKDMGKRGARKKNKNLSIFSKDPNHPLNIIFGTATNDFAIEQIEVIKFAFELLKNKKNKAIKSNEVASSSSANAGAAAAASTTTMNNNVDFGSDDEAEAEPEHEVTEINESDLQPAEEQEEDDEEETADSNDDDEVELTTSCNKTITYVISENDVYDPNDVDAEGAATWIGKFYEMEKKYANVNYENKDYAILRQLTCNVDNKPYEALHCVLNNNVFDMKKTFVGKYVEKNGKYEIEFAKKKVASKK